MRDIGKVYALNGKEINCCVGVNIAVSVVPSDKSFTLSGVRLFEVATDLSICDKCSERERCNVDEKELLKKTQSYLIKKKVFP